ncbi:hypothetical protein SeSA_B0073 (plasmid) [Salmonella enterica subsp. enterica serovar Schwarzengrund str. CVM19633]|uniref:Uncharacterized protein n=1 Tax=Salmonella schwarzengrund (strain CVM19633) TaxID=439843 RepID=A0A0U1RFB0_SALSV|nr:hypothetical protein SeSA_B0073 [Salmonella enterica subsp. enterica serovar Schwarzengrund str. CVM19633]
MREPSGIIFGAGPVGFRLLGVLAIRFVLLSIAVKKAAANGRR